MHSRIDMHIHAVCSCLDVEHTYKSDKRESSHLPFCDTISVRPGKPVAVACESQSAVATIGRLRLCFTNIRTLCATLGNFAHKARALAERFNYAT